MKQNQYWLNSVRARIFWLLIVFLAIPAFIFSQFTLENVEKEIEKEYPITHVNINNLKEKLSSSDSSEYLLFDIREKEEYDKSHIHSAIWIDPDMSGNDFIDQYGAKIKRKHLVFYCSVGKRSSIFVERVLKKALTANRETIANLRGGIFRWYNNGFPVVNANGETDDIHPYNVYWGQLIERRTK